MKRLPITLIFLVIIAGLAAQGHAQKKDPSGDNRFYADLMNDEDMRVVQSQNRLSNGDQFGAWITPTYIHQEAPSTSSDIVATTFRVWLKTFLWNNSYIYARGKDTYTGVLWQTGSGRTKNKNVADLDLGYLSAATERRDIEFSIGRKYFLLGSGLVLDGRGDGVEFNYFSKYINVKVLGSWSGWLVKDDNPYGLSDRDIATGARRIFAGGSLSTEWFNQTLYAFGLAQFDFGKENYNAHKKLVSAIGGFDLGFRLYGQKSHYESQYYGAGLQGVMVSANSQTLAYNGEAIMERGRSHLSGYPIITDVLAYAGTFKLTYYINVLLKPMIIAQYAFGSGDVNRTDYRLPNGNTKGKDRGFLYFGTFVGGYALRPLLANLHMISGSVSFSPFSWSNVYSAKNMTIILKYMYYLKHQAQSPINYGQDATLPYREIGHGADASLRWLIFSDLSFFLNYGLFVPGKAFGFHYDFIRNIPTFSSTGYRHFVMGGFNISF